MMRRRCGRKGEDTHEDVPPKEPTVMSALVVVVVTNLWQAVVTPIEVGRSGPDSAHIFGVETMKEMAGS